MKNLKITLVVLVGLILTSSLSAREGNQASFDLGRSIGDKLGKSSQKSITDSSSKSNKYSSNENKTIDFIAVNMNKLALEAAQGEGETINALSIMMNKDSKVLSIKMQTNFENIFSSTNVSAKDIATKINTL